MRQFAVLAALTLFLTATISGQWKKLPNYPDLGVPFSPQFNAALKSGLVLMTGAPKLIEEYEANEVAADRKYSGRLVCIGGIVERVGKDIIGDPYMTFRVSSARPFTVQAYFAPSELDAVADLKPRETPLLMCTGAGKAVNVVLRLCNIIGK